jgi:hypothetical protein
VLKAFAFLVEFMPVFFKLAAGAGELCPAEGVMTFKDVADDVKLLKSLVLSSGQCDALVQSGFGAQSSSELQRAAGCLQALPGPRLFATVAKESLMKRFMEWQADFGTALLENGVSADDSPLYMELMADCEAIGDSRLVLQLKFISSFGRFEQAGRAFEQVWRPAAGEDINEDARSIIVKDIRQKFEDLALASKKVRAMHENGLKEIFGDCAAYGCFVFHDVDAPAVAEAGLAHCDSMASDARSAWALNLKMLCGKLADWCPNWQAESKAENFPSKDRIKTLLTNPHYKELTPGANMVADMLSAHGTLVHNGAPI